DVVIADTRPRCCDRSRVQSHIDTCILLAYHKDATRGERLEEETMGWRNKLQVLSSVMVLSVVCVPAAFAQELQPLTMRLAFTAGGVDAPFFVALGKGYFKEEGLDVEILDGNGSTGTIQAVANNNVEISNASLGALIQASATA